MRNIIARTRRVNTHTHTQGACGEIVIGTLAWTVYIYIPARVRAFIKRKRAPTIASGNLPLLDAAHEGGREGGRLKFAGAAPLRFCSRCCGFFLRVQRGYEGEDEVECGIVRFKWRDGEREGRRRVFRIWAERACALWKNVYGCGTEVERFEKRERHAELYTMMFRSVKREARGTRAYIIYIYIQILPPVGYLLDI